jgi:hypothetical protein
MTYYKEFCFYKVLNASNLMAFHELLAIVNYFVRQFDLISTFTALY